MEQRLKKYFDFSSFLHGIGMQNFQDNNIKNQRQEIYFFVFPTAPLRPPK